MACENCKRMEGTIEMSIEGVLMDGINMLNERRVKHGYQYGEVYKQFGSVLMSLFPQGINIEPHETNKATRLGVIVQIVTKLSRYCAQFDEGGHEDSAMDGTNYFAMLKSVTYSSLEDNKKCC